MSQKYQKGKDPTRMGPLARIERWNKALARKANVPKATSESKKLQRQSGSRNLVTQGGKRRKRRSKRRTKRKTKRRTKRRTRRRSHKRRKRR